MSGFVLALVAASLVAQAPPSTTQQQGPTVVVTQPDETKFPEITVYYEVKRADQSFILDARRDEFRVTEDGQDRPILRFEAPISTESRPTTVILVVDHSESMLWDDRLGALKRAVATFLKGLPVGSRVAVVAFSSEVWLACPFTTDLSLVQEAVDQLEAEGGTCFFDAVYGSLELLAQQSGRRAILALTDGQDSENSPSKFEAIIARARTLGLPVHTLGLGNEKKIAVEDLARLATETRGQHYLAKDAASLSSIYEEIAQRLGSSYSLTYQTDRKIPDGTLRPIRVYYEKAIEAGETAVFIRGMVAPVAGWSRLFVVLLVFLVVLTRYPHLKT